MTESIDRRGAEHARGVSMSEERCTGSLHGEARLLPGPRRDAHRDGRRDQEGLSPAGDEIAIPTAIQHDHEAEEKFKEAKEAYEVLSDPQKRAAYDQFGHAGVDAARGAAAQGFDPRDAFGDIFGDVFGDIFGGGRRSRSQVFRGADLRYELELDLEQAVFGDTVNLDVPTLARVRGVQGLGLGARARSPSTCETCRGAGQVRMQQGFFTVQQTCPRCQGRGQVVSDPCGTCRGQGRVRKQKTLSVKVPAGRRHRRPHPA